MALQVDCTTLLDEATFDQTMANGGSINLFVAVGPAPHTRTPTQSQPIVVEMEDLDAAGGTLSNVLFFFLTFQTLIHWHAFESWSDSDHN
jgi:hypothetical protein